MNPIPIKEAQRIADYYDYDQVVVIARKVGEGEHVTTYGRGEEHCSIAARIGEFLKFKVLGWVEEQKHEQEKRTEECPHGYKDWDNCPDCCH